MTVKETILNRVYWILSDHSGARAWPDGLLAEILPMMNHDGDLYVISQGLRFDRDHLLRLLEDVADHLSRWGFCRVNLRPVHPVGKDELGELRNLYNDIHQLAEPFYREALRHQVVSRLVVLPVLRVHSESEMREIMVFAGYLRERMMIPSFYIPASPRYEKLTGSIGTNRERIILEKADGPVGPLMLHDLFDELLQWALSSSGGFSVNCCRALLVDTVRRTLRRCFRVEEQAYTDLQGILLDDGIGPCIPCWHALPGELREALRWNGSEDEGDRVEHQLGVFAFSRGDLERAAQHFQSLAMGSSSDEIRAESLLYQGILHLQRGEVESAYSALTEARRLLKDSSEVLYHLGRCEFAWCDYIAASDLFEQALEVGIAPEIEDDLFLYLGISHVKLDEYQRALDFLNMAQGRRTSILFYRAMALLGLGRLQEALAGFRDALECGPAPEDLASVHFYIGHCLKEMEQWEEAMSHLRMALRVDPQSYDSWNLLGYCLFRLKRNREAVKAFLKALEINPKSAIDYANVASNLRDLGELGEAAKWYKEALRLDPTLGFAAENLDKLETMKDET
jgi:tetratricopeptide (TPR) repeat protein